MNGKTYGYETRNREKLEVIRVIAEDIISKEIHTGQRYNTLPIQHRGVVDKKAFVERTENYLAEQGIYKEEE